MKTRIEAFTHLFLALAAAAALSTLAGCDGTPLPEPAADTGAPSDATPATPVQPDAADAKAPPCHDLAAGAELPDGLGANVSCLAACTNVAGGWTCIKAGGVTVYCEACGG